MNRPKGAFAPSIWEMSGETPRRLHLLRRLVAGWLLLSLLVAFSMELGLKGWKDFGKQRAALDFLPFGDVSELHTTYRNCSVFTTIPAWAGGIVGGSTGITVGLALGGVAAAADFVARLVFGEGVAPFLGARENFPYSVDILLPAWLGAAYGNAIGGKIASAPFLVVERTVDRLFGRSPRCLDW
jgi:hypothetical protein